MEHLQDSLNEQQKKAVKHDKGPLLILAGAGSGKTRVITHRIINLIQLGVPTYSIMAVTFTNKAAGEMRERVHVLCDQIGFEFSHAGLWIGTFHSTCARLLRMYGDRIGLNRQFVIYDQDDQKRLVKLLLKQKYRTPETGEVAQLCRYFDSKKSYGISPDKAIEKARGRDEEDRAFLYKDYTKALASAQAVDFGGLLMSTVTLLATEPDLREQLNKRFQYVLVDEFQDTNPIQYTLLKQLTRDHKNLTVVGDDDQAIYRFRGATPDNIINFDRDYKNCKVVRLEQNYRSTSAILSAAHNIIAIAKNRAPKKLWTARSGGEPLRIFEGTNQREETIFIQNTILKLRDQGYSYKDMAILYRINALGSGAEAALRRARIPYRVIGPSFFQRAVVRDILAYIKVAINPSDRINILRSINQPPRGLGAKSLSIIMEDWSNSGGDFISSAQALGQTTKLKGRAKKGLNEYIDLITTVQQDISDFAVHDLIGTIVSKSGYHALIKRKDPEIAEDELELLSHLQVLLSDAMLKSHERNMDLGESESEENRSGNSIEEFLELVALVQDTDKLENSDSVTLMTVHSAKGLEFPIVFITGMEDGLFPHRRAKDNAEEDEERRLAYVAITRAKNQVYFTACRERTLMGQTRPASLSPFLDDIKPEFIVRDPQSVRQYRSYADQWNKPNMTFRRATGSQHSNGGDQNQNKNSFEDYEFNQTSSYNQQESGRKKDSRGGIKAGDTVTHKRFGIGEVLGIEGTGQNARAEVRFPMYGTKKIVTRFLQSF